MDVDPRQYNATQLCEWLSALGLRQSGTKAEMTLRLNAVPPAERGDPPPREAESLEVNGAPEVIENVLNENDNDVFVDAAVGEEIADASEAVAQQSKDLENELTLVKRERDLLMKEINLLKKKTMLTRVRAINEEGNSNVETESPLPFSAIREIISEFDGNTNFDFWATQVRSIMNVYHTSENAMRVLIAAKFSGKAQKWLHANVN